MPKWLHDKLARAGRKKGLTGKRLKAYIFSVLRDYKVKQLSKRKGIAKP